MRVISYVGSMRGRDSLGYKTVQYLIKGLGKDWNSEIYLANEKQINTCKGCCACFNTGRCPLDENDSMGNIKKAMLSADLLIVSSPVYLHQISGTMKNFIDRIAYWTHLYKLIGKRIILCTSTCTNGSEYAMAYLKKAFACLGCYLIAEINADIYTDDLVLDKKIEQIKGTLDESYGNPTLHNMLQQEETFQILKNQYRAKDTYEAKYWKQNGLFEYSSFEQLIRERL